MTSFQHLAFILHGTMMEGITWQARASALLWVASPFHEATEDIMGPILMTSANPSHPIGLTFKCQQCTNLGLSLQHMTFGRMHSNYSHQGSLAWIMIKDAKLSSSSQAFWFQDTFTLMNECRSQELLLRQILSITIYHIEKHS